MANILKNRFVNILLLLVLAVILRFVVMDYLDESYQTVIRICAMIAIFFVGVVFVLRGTANVIEETTEILSERTKLASGLLQSLGTAFPDMVLGLVAAVVSLRVASTNITLATNFAIIAAATTFGSNIYNIGHAAWCVFKQNYANHFNRPTQMFPYIKMLGTVTPISSHITKPSVKEVDASIDVLNILTVLTSATAISMVIFGQVANPTPGISGDLYQLVKPVGAVIFVLCLFILYHFRKTERGEVLVEEIIEEDKYYRHKSTLTILIFLLLSGAAILLAAESMVHAIETFSHLSGMPFVISGVLTGVIGCLGEMIVIHNFTVNPKGRIGDAVVGVGMDNIVTTMGAAIIAMMGGIFLGGNALIIIFILILTLNTTLIWQLSKLKNYLFMISSK